MLLVPCKYVGTSYGLSKKLKSNELKADYCTDTACDRENEVQSTMLKPMLARGPVVQWFSALAAVAMLSARTWVQISPTTSGVFCL